MENTTETLQTLNGVARKSSSRERVLLKFDFLANQKLLREAIQPRNEILLKETSLRVLLGLFVCLLFFSPNQIVHETDCNETRARRDWSRTPGGRGWGRCLPRVYQ